MFEVRFLGLEEYVKALRGSEEAFQKGIREAIGEASVKVANLAVSRAPVRTGRLRDSIEVYHIGGSGGVRVKAPYAGFVEFGTRRMAAQPYLRPSVTEVQPFFQRLLLEKIRAEIEER